MNEDGRLTANVVQDVGVIDSDTKSKLKNYITQILLYNGLIHPTLDQHLLSEAIDLKQVDFTFIELAGWRNRINREPSTSMTIVYSDVDERLNRVRIGILQTPNAANINSYLAALEIPSGAVIFEQTEPLVVAQELDERTRPLRGGLGIQDSNGDGDPGCTLGVPVWYGQLQGGDPTPETNPWGWLTAAHCTEFIDIVEPRDMYQTHFLHQADYVGWELREAPWYDCGSQYPCLDADVALINSFGLDDETLGPNVGEIHLTTSLGTLQERTIDGYIWITLDRQPLTGEPVQKVGNNSGWTSGEVTGTCVDATVYGFRYHIPWGDPNGSTTTSYARMNCHVATDVPVLGRDSGSALFYNRGSGRGDFLGILSWCSGCTSSIPGPGRFASWNNIQVALGNDVRTRLE